MQEENLQEYNRKIADFAEKRRLQAETEAFARQIQERRMNEVQKCFQKHISNLNWKLEKLSNAEKDHRYHLYKNSDLQSERIQEYDKCKIAENIISNFEDTDSRNYKKLQHDVTKLEYEVQSFFGFTEIL